MKEILSAIRDKLSKVEHNSTIQEKNLEGVSIRLRLLLSIMVAMNNKEEHFQSEASNEIPVTHKNLRENSY